MEAKKRTLTNCQAIGDEDGKAGDVSSWFNDNNVGNDADEDEDPSPMKSNQSRWIKLAMDQTALKSHNLSQCAKGHEFADLHNQASADFMNQYKFQCFILKQSNDKDPPQWELLDEMGLQVIEHVVEDEDQGPFKE